jgi:hypothetical protein
MVSCEKCGTALAPAEAHCSTCGAPAPQQKSAVTLRQQGIRMEKEASETGRPELLARAGQAFLSAVGQDDSDAIAHQLFIANAARQGKLSLATEYYQKRLAANTSDEVAQKQLQVIRLSADFLAKPPPALSKPLPGNPLERWLKPRPWKVGAVGLNLLICLAMAVVSAFHDKDQVPIPGDLGSMLGSAMPVNLDAFLYDVNVWVLQAALSALVLYLMYRNR